MGSPEGAGRAFTELIEREYVSSAWQDSTDRMFYHYDTAGRLLLSAFAGTKKTTGWSGWPDDDDPGWFMHATRAVQENIYDPAGRVLSVANYWQEYNGTTGAGANQVPTYSTEAIPDAKVAYTYGSTTGLRSAQGFFTNSGTGWASSPYRTESYSYDSNLDYLTSVNYDVGGTNETHNWSYDAAGNRAGTNWVYDNLNRMTKSALTGSGLTYTTYENDILGNRTGKNLSYSYSNAVRYVWDVLNRAKVIAGVSTGGSYGYRADGQRVEKVEDATISWVSTGGRSGYYDTNYASNAPSCRYFYDGQMGFEDDYNPSGSVTKINRYALGARGIDRIENYESSTTTYGYPLYDGHGNMRAVLTKSGSTYATGNWRTYDVWGSVRSGSATGNPKQRYVANLGHVADDESGLTYMRARYYEPSTGRFISEDPSMQDLNWFLYVSNRPTCLVDPSGKFYIPPSNVMAALGMGFAALSLWQFGKVSSTYIGEAVTMHHAVKSASFAVLGAFCYAIAAYGVEGTFLSSDDIGAICASLMAFAAIIAVMHGSATKGANTLAAAAIFVTYVYGLLLIGELVGDDAWMVING